jgi:hypothetical protein
MAIAVAASSQPAMLLSIGIVLQAYDVKRASKGHLAVVQLLRLSEVCHPFVLALRCQAT